MFDVQKILRETYKQRKLAPFYIVRSLPPTWGQKPTNLLNWSQNLITSLLADHYSLNWEEAHTKSSVGHADILTVTKDPENKNYKAEEQGIIEFLKAHEHPPIELYYKIIIVNEADKITPQLANKFLKTLEEPTENVTTLFLVEGSTALLQTIESRAITFRLRERPSFSEDAVHNFGKVPDSFHDFVFHLCQENSDLRESLSLSFSLTISEGQWNTLKAAGKNQKIHGYLDFAKSSHQCEEILTQMILEYASHSQLHFFETESILQEIQWAKESKTYNNSNTDRLIGLLQSVTTINLGV